MGTECTCGTVPPYCKACIDALDAWLVEADRLTKNTNVVADAASDALTEWVASHAGRRLAVDAAVDLVEGIGERLGFEPYLDFHPSVIVDIALDTNGRTWRRQGYVACRRRGCARVATWQELCSVHGQAVRERWLDALPGVYTQRELKSVREALKPVRDALLREKYHAEEAEREERRRQRARESEARANDRLRACYAPGKRRGYVYRLYDAEGRLLYVGKTYRVKVRLDQHADDKPWFGDVRRVTVKVYRNETAAFAAESWAIKREHPVYNRARPEPHTPRAPRALLIYSGDL